MAKSTEFGVAELQLVENPGLCTPENPEGPGAPRVDQGSNVHDHTDLVLVHSFEGISQAGYQVGQAC